MTDFERRKQLPAPMAPSNDVSIWSVLKNCIGKDLSKTTMPVVLNEPLSFLQRICEYMEYKELLQKASQEDDPADRMKYVATFAVSALASNWERFGKPFNPLLGETYELQRKNYRIVCEQVCHHPPISAFYAESADFKLYGSIYPKLKFSGKTVIIQPKGIMTVELTKWNETYTWNHLNCCVHNVLMGKLWIEQHGIVEIVNHTTGHKAILTFKDSATSSKNINKVEGFIQDPSKHNIYALYGNWTSFIRCCTWSSYENYTKEKALAKRNENHDHISQAAVLSKLKNFKMHSFRSLSIQDTDNSLSPESETDNETQIDIADSVLLWECLPRPENAAQYYQFTDFTMQLNELEPDMIPPKTLCPTDSRLRPDIRSLENGDIEGASNEKKRLEEKQRNAKKERKTIVENDWKPRWFSLSTHPYTNKEDWFYTGGFWDRDYSNISTIF